MSTIATERPSVIGARMMVPTHDGYCGGETEGLCKEGHLLVDTEITPTMESASLNYE